MTENENEEQPGADGAPLDEDYDYDPPLADDDGEDDEDPR